MKIIIIGREAAANGSIPCPDDGQPHEWSGTGACLTPGHDGGYSWAHRDPGYPGPPYR